MKENRGGVLTREAIQSVFTPKALGQILKQDFPTLSKKDLDNLQLCIEKFGRKLYAVLILMEKSRLIKKILVPDGTQGEAPETFADDAILRKHYPTLEELKRIPRFRDIAPNFYATQWVIAPTLHRDHQDFPVKEFKISVHKPVR